MPYDYRKHIFRSPKLKSVVDEAVHFFNETPCHHLPPPEQFVGPGVYALYYKGSFPEYLEVVEFRQDDCSQPIYIGKAVPPGTRTARVIDSKSADICRRLGEHARSLDQAKNLALKDFRCRFMIMQGRESQLIGTVESSLIRKHRPLWNICVDGFGNHDPGSGRYDQARSEWDVLHPGRLWAKRLRGKSCEPKKVIEKIRQYVSSLPPHR